MCIKRWLLISLTLSLSTFNYSHAAQVPPNLRGHLEFLAAQGVIQSPISSQPINVKMLTSELEQCYHQANFTASIRDKCLFISQALTHSSLSAPQLYSHAGNQEALFPATMGASSTQSQVALSLPLQTGKLSANIQVARVSDPFDNDEVRLDGSQLSYEIGNWQLGVGAFDRWWGPGWHSSLILSNNARPSPGLFLSRIKSTNPNSKWLSWVGHWQMTTFMNQLESDRTVPNALLWGARINFRPTYFNRNGMFEIGLSRTAMWAGEGRPKDLSVFADLLIGNDNFKPGDEGKATEPGNQLGGVDFLFSRPISRLKFAAFPAAYSIYGQVIGEDEAGGLPSRPMAMFGASFNQQLKQAQWVLFTELSDTSLDVFKSEKIFNSAYNHSIYESGYRYKGRSIGSQYDNDTRAVSIGSNWNNHKQSTQLVVSRLELNRDSTAALNSVSSNQLKASSVEFYYQHHFDRFDLGLIAFYISELPNNQLGIDDSNRVALTLHIPLK